MLNNTIALLMLAVSVSTHAVVIDAGRFTRDTETGLDWLDVTETRGLSYYEVEAQLAQGGAFQGWRFATVQELDQLITNFGYVAINTWDCGFGLINCDDYYSIPGAPEDLEIIEYMIRTLGDTQKESSEESNSRFQVSPTGAGATSGWLQWFDANAGDRMLPWGLIQDAEMVDGTDSTLSDSADIVMSWYIHRIDEASRDLGSFLVRPSEGPIPTVPSNAFFSTTGFGATHLARFPAASSAATTIGPFPPPGTWDSMAFDPNGLLYAGGNLGDLVVINQETGNSERIGNVGFLFLTAMAFDKRGRLFAFSVDRAYELDPSNAKPTLIADLNLPIGGLAYDPATENFLATTVYGSQLYEFDPDVPSLTYVTDLGVDEEGNFTRSIEVTPEGNIFVASRGGYIYQLNDDYSKRFLGKPVEYDVRSLAYGPSFFPDGLLAFIEAESMVLSGGYAVEYNAEASAGELIRRLDSGGQPATASAQFKGSAGRYDIAVSYFDESDGRSSLALFLNGQPLEQWVADEDPVCRDCASPGASTLRTRVVARGVLLRPGVEIGLQGTGDYYEYARFDKITLSPEGLNSLEAEMMTLEGGYVVEDNAAASGGKLIRRLDSGGYAASATTEFAGLAGTYDITVSYFDESDGISSLAFLLNGEMLDQWLADEDPLCADCASPGESTLRTRLVAKEIRLVPGDDIALQGTGEHYEYARFDKITLAPVNFNTLEAERMTLDDGFVVEANAAASGGQIIRGNGPADSAPGQASAVFMGSKGTYDITVTYFDEYDGISNMAVFLNNQLLDQWLADENPICGACASPNEKTLRKRVVAKEIEISPGDDIRLESTVNQYEFGRFDKVDFTRIFSP